MWFLIVASGRSVVEEAEWRSLAGMPSRMRPCHLYLYNHAGHGINESMNDHNIYNNMYSCREVRVKEFESRTGAGGCTSSWENPKIDTYRINYQGI